MTKKYLNAANTTQEKLQWKETTVKLWKTLLKNFVGSSHTESVF